MASNTAYEAPVAQACRGDYEHLALFMPQDSSITDERMIQHKLWFMLKHMKKGMPYIEADAWSSIWVMVKYNKCTYDADIMNRVVEMGNAENMTI